MLLTQAVRESVVSFRAKVAVVASIVLFAWAGSIDRLAVIPVRSFGVALARHAIRVAIVSVVATVAVGRCVLLAALAFPGRVRAISRRVDQVAVARYRRRNEALALEWGRKGKAGKRK